MFGPYHSVLETTLRFEYLFMTKSFTLKILLFYKRDKNTHRIDNIWSYSFKWLLNNYDLCDDKIYNLMTVTVENGFKSVANKHIQFLVRAWDIIFKYF